MGKSVSPYYPPRARWYGGVLEWGYTLRRRLVLDRVRLPSGVPFSHVVASLLVPGLGFWLRGPRLWGLAAFGASALLWLVFFFWLGSPPANIAFGLLISIHGTGLVYLLEPWLAGARFRFRILCSFALVALLSMLVYLPARQFMQTHWLMPLQVKGRAVVVRVARPAAAGRQIRRGEWVAYSIAGSYGDGVYVRDGFGLSPLLAAPGDRVRFTPTALEVNGTPQARLPTMPSAGELVLPEKHWLVWPDVAIGGHGYGPDISAVLLQMATISEQQFIGKPFKRWFWRRQIPA